jgi:hypothetical protein
MKNVFARTSLLILAGLSLSVLAGCQTAKPVGTAQGHADTVQDRLANVLRAKERAGLECARIVIDNGQIASVGLHSGPYLVALKKIDVSGCPENFRAAWSDYLAAWDRKRKEEQATRETIDAISMWKGGYDDLPATVRSIEAYDTQSAWDNCEHIAAGWGVAVAKPGLTSRSQTAE